MIIRKSPAEIERMARAGAVVADTLALIGERAQPGVTTQELDELADEFIRSRGGDPDVQGLPRLPGVDLHLAERHGRPRDPGPYALARGRPALGRRRRDARRLRRGLGLHVPDRRGLARGRAAARGLPGGARGRDRAVPVGNRLSDISHAIQRVDRGARLLRRSQPRRPRRRPRRCTRSRRSRTSASPAAGPLLAEGMTLRDRADDQRRRRRGRPARRRVVDLDRRRLALGPLRAHRGDHRRRTRGS